MERGSGRKGGESGMKLNKFYDNPGQRPIRVRGAVAGRRSRGGGRGSRVAGPMAAHLLLCGGRLMIVC